MRRDSGHFGQPRKKTRRRTSMKKGCKNSLRTLEPPPGGPVKNIRSQKGNPSIKESRPIIHQGATATKSFIEATGEAWQVEKHIKQVKDARSEV